MYGKSRFYATIEAKDAAGQKMSGLWDDNGKVCDGSVLKVRRLYAGFTLKTHLFATFPPGFCLESAVVNA